MPEQGTEEGAGRGGTGAPSLQEQTIELGRTLKAIADEDPSGTPSAQAAAVFAGWLALAGPSSREPVYLADVADNYDVLGNTNKDLWEIFDILENYIEVEDEEPPAAPRTFIGLPLVSG
jgi:hypothetical protein